MKVKLAHINSYYLSNTLHAELVEYLSHEDSDIKQIVYVPLMGKGKSDIIHEEERTELVLSNCFNKYTRFIWPAKIWQIYTDFKFKLRNREINVTHSHSLISNGIISYLIYKLKKTPYVVTVRNTDINIFLKRSAIFRKLGEKILVKSSSVVVLSPAYKDQQLKNNITEDVFAAIQHKLHVVPNGVNDYWIKNSYNIRREINGIVDILFVGKLRQNKNITGLISACTILADRGVRLRLTVAGEGELRDSILGKNYNFDLNYLGFVESREKLLEVYRSCHIMAVPSYRESFGLVYVEAMTQGLPVIYTKGQGFDGNFREGEIGFSVEPDNHKEIADKLGAIITDYRDMSARAVKASSNFSWKATSGKLMSLYKKAIQ